MHELKELELKELVRRKIEKLFHFYDRNDNCFLCFLTNDNKVLSLGPKIIEPGEIATHLVREKDQVIQSCNEFNRYCGKMNFSIVWKKEETITPEKEDSLFNVEYPETHEIEETIEFYFHDFVCAYFTWSWDEDCINKDIILVEHSIEESEEILKKYNENIS